MRAMVWTKSATSAICSHEGFRIEIRPCESEACAESSSRQPRQKTDRANMFRVIRHSPAILLAAGLIFGAATFVAVPLLAQNLLAQNGEPQKPAEAGKGEPAKAEAAKGEPAKGEPAKDVAGRSDESAEPVRILMGPAGRG